MPRTRPKVVVPLGQPPEPFPLLPEHLARHIITVPVLPRRRHPLDVYFFHVLVRISI
jgi:hypothetical protein